MHDWNSARLRRAAEQRRGRKTVFRLGETLSDYVQKRVLPRQKRLFGLGAVWAELLPAEMLEHTNFAHMRRGKLTVQVDSAAHLYELKLLLAGGLLEEVRERCPQAGLREIKLQLGDWRRPEDGPSGKQKKENL